MGRPKAAASGRLWAPWRRAYLLHQRSAGCIFCAARRSHADRRHHVVARGDAVFTLLNRYPYNNGHVMIAPYRHIGTLDHLRPAEWGELLTMAQRVVERLTRGLRPHGFNVGLNLGRAAGAGILGHLHLHVVPRWAGDTNFMPVLGHTKVISQSLDEVYRLLTSPDGRRR